MEYTIRVPGTSVERDVRARGKMFFDDQGTPVRFTGTVQDVTQKNMALKAIQSIGADRFIRGGARSHRDLERRRRSPVLEREPVLWRTHLQESGGYHWQAAASSPS